MEVLNTLKRTSVAAGLGALAFLAVAFPVFAKAGNFLASPDFQKYNIFGLIHDLVGTSDAMLSQSQALHDKAVHLGGKLGLIEKQNEIVAQQIQQTQAMQATLDAMQANEDKTLSLMQTILQTEGQTVQLSSQVNAITAATAQSVVGTANTLQHLGAMIPAIQQSTDVMNSEMDLLITELQQSKYEFRSIGSLSNLLRILHLTP